MEFISDFYGSKPSVMLLFSCRYLALGNLRDANHLIDELKKQEEHGELEFPDSELIEFIIYLLLT